MMRTVWKGTIGFGAFGIPVKVYSATEEHGVGLRQLHQRDGGRVKYLRVCELDGAEVPSAEIVKGYQMPGGDVVMVTEEDFAGLPLPTAHSMDVRAFAPMDQIDPIYFAKSYYLEPEPAGTKPYVLFSEALQHSGRVAVVKIALRQRETLGVLRVRDQVLMLETMMWPDEIRTPDFPFQHEDVDLRPGELRTAVRMIERLAGDFEPRQYTDEYRGALEELIGAKVDGNEVVQPTAAEQAAGVTALLAALQNRVEDATDVEAAVPAVTKAKTAARKAARSSATAKKAAAKTRSKAKTQN
jgi:DNA end-binding protein Ku